MPLVLFEEDPDSRVGYGWCKEMLARGVYLRPWHNMFLAACTTDADIDLAIAAGDASFPAIAARRAELQPSPVLVAMAAARSKETLESLA